MASRIVIEEPCKHGYYGAHTDYPSIRPYGTAYPVTESCPGGSRRVLDPGSFKAHVADALLFEGWTCDTHEPDPDCGECQIGYERLSQRIWDALAGGEKP